MTDYQGSVVAKFADLDSANRALRNLRDAQKDKNLRIREGAVVIGTPDGVMPVADLDDVSLGDVTGSAIDLMMFLGVGSLKIATEAAISGAALLLSSARRAASLGGTLLTLPAKVLLSAFDDDSPADHLVGVIQPGVCVIVAVADGPTDTAQLIAELSESGGEILDIEVDEEQPSETAQAE